MRGAKKRLLRWWKFHREASGTSTEAGFERKIEPIKYKTHFQNQVGLWRGNFWMIATTKEDWSMAFFIPLKSLKWIISECHWIISEMTRLSSWHEWTIPFEFEREGIDRKKTEECISDRRTNRRAKERTHTHWVFVVFFLCVRAWV